MQTHSENFSAIVVRTFPLALCVAVSEIDSWSADGSIFARKSKYVSGIDRHVMIYYTVDLIVHDLSHFLMSGGT